MAIYCFRDQATGEVIDEVYPLGKAPRRIHREGKTYVRDIAHEHHARWYSGKGLWPRNSAAAGVWPSQVEDQKAYDKSIGFTAPILPNGDVVFNSPKHERDYLKAHGMKNLGDYR